MLGTGGSLNLARTGTNDSYTVTNTTGLGRVSSFAVDNVIANGKNLRTNTDPSGFSTTTLLGTDQSQTITTPDGTVTTVSNKPDPRWGMQAPLSSLKVTTPGGLISNLTTARSVTLATPTDPLSLTSQTDTLNLNGRTFTSVFDANLLKITDTTPVGRTTTSFVDSQEKLTKFQVPGFLDRDFGYDIRGRLTTISQGTGVDQRTTIIAYNPQGFVDSYVDAESRTVKFEYDLAGRVTKQILPDLREINFAYDANGNVTSATPPGRPSHSFTYTFVNFENRYDPPNIGLPQHATQLQYNLDQQITQILRPDGKTIAINYDTGGRLDNMVIPRGTLDYGYDPGNGNLNKITAPDGATLDITFDGFLQTSTTWGGPAGSINGSVSQTYDNSYRVTSRSVNGGNTVNFVYDNDDLVTSAGALSLSYDSQNGLITGTTLGAVDESYTFSSFAELETYTANSNSTSVFQTQFVRDKLGRITQKTETVQGVTHVFDYSYDSAGRLAEVKKDSLVTATYTYDPNSNRIGGVYDNQSYSQMWCMGA